MSFHTAVVRNNFANEMRTLWSYWDTMDNTLHLGIAAILMSDVQLRQRFIRDAIARVVTFMPVPTVTFTNQLAANVHGQFKGRQWEILINSNSLNHIGYGDFVELASTIYHELRHGEQFFRIAQGLACGQLTFPGLSQDQRNRRTFDPTQHNHGLSAVQSGQQVFGGGAIQHALSAQQIATLIYIPNNVATAAALNAAAQFQGFTNTARPNWFSAATVLDEVKDWLNTTFKTSYKQTYIKKNTDPNGDDVVRAANGDTNAYLIYRSHPMEKDAFGVETYIKPQVQLVIGVNPTVLPLIGRAHAAFNHLPA